MNKVKLNEIISCGNIVLPMYLFHAYKKFDLTLDEFVILMYLYDKNGNSFDPEKISLDLSLDIMETMGYISSLSDKGLLSIDAKKSEKGILEEKINLDNFYEKITLNLIDELSKEDETVTNIFELIESEFARELTPFEKSFAKEWEDNYSYELIKEAVREASLNGIQNLRYIDKILFEWGKKGIKTKKEIKEKDKNETKVEIYNCNWLDDDDDE